MSYTWTIQMSDTLILDWLLEVLNNPEPYQFQWYSKAEIAKFVNTVRNGRNNSTLAKAIRDHGANAINHLKDYR